MLKACCAASAAALTIFTAGAAAAANLITFEEPILTAMPNAPGGFVPAGSQLSTQFLNTLGVSFSSGSGYVAVVDHGYPALTPTPPNVIGGTNAFGQLDYTAVIRATFFDPSNTGNQATTNRVRVLGELFGFGSGTVTLSAFNLSGTLIGQVSDNDNYPLGMGPVLELNLAGIHSVTFSGTSGTVAFDNFEFNTVSAAVVPEPGAWTLMILGFGVVGAGLRRRRVAST